METDISNPYGKIPVIYYWQKETEWHDVQSMIGRLENGVSNLGDENDYFGKPILFFKGKLKGMADKSSGGKTLSGDQNADAKYLSWDHAPQSLELEFKTLDAGIYKFSQTPDISFESVKGIGNVSGKAFRMLFSDAHMAARTKETLFGEGIQRRLNFLKHVSGEVIYAAGRTEAKEIVIKPKFTPYVPEDPKEDIEMLVIAKEGGIMSQQTAVEKNPLIINTEKEMEQLEDDNQNQPPIIGETFNL
jgi:SPP1 family phage portal protein